MEKKAVIRLIEPLGIDFQVEFKGINEPDEMDGARKIFEEALKLAGFEVVYEYDLGG
jgi:hypothetical protein